MRHLWIRPVFFVACIGMVGLLSGCVGWTASSVGEESKAQSLKLPEVVVEERIEEAPVVASSVPPPLDFEPVEPSVTLASTEPPVEAPVELPVESPIEPPADLIQEEELPPPGPFLLDIPFNFDQSGLRDDALTFLEVNAIRLKDEGVEAVVLEGRGDEVGTTDYNLVLGERRALAVKRYLRNLGLDPSRMVTTSYGKERPLCNEHNIECWQLNRSVHFVVQE